VYSTRLRSSTLDSIASTWESHRPPRRTATVRNSRGVTLRRWRRPSWLGHKTRLDKTQK
jgi:hypothetical protein